MTDFWTDILKFAEATTQKIANQIINDFGKLPAERKNDGTLVTEADKWSDGAIRAAISQAFPEHGVLTEETTHIFPENPWCWIVDPIDGTTNFTRGIPIWGISLGLLYQGTPVFGFVYFPQIQQSFHGYWSGNSGLNVPTGAYLNNQPIHTSSDEPSKNHLFNLCARSTSVLKNPFPCKMRMIGVASYNILLVATGASLGGVEATPKIWDIAGAWPILQASGGILIPLDSQPIFPLTVGKNYGNVSFPCLVASREELVSVFQPLVQEVRQQNS
jgi:myo-inositol-1(or 4)-monophosphatase